MKLNLRTYRERAGLTQADLAERIARDQIWISRLERRENPKISDVEAYLRGLNLRLYESVETVERIDLLTRLTDKSTEDLLRVQELLAAWENLSPDQQERVLGLLRAFLV